MTVVEEKGNRILAHIMGVEYQSDLNYHEDWNKLMPVWVKLPIKQERPNVRYITESILGGDVRESWGLIVGYINNYVLTEEEYLKFKL